MKTQSSLLVISSLALLLFLSPVPTAAAAAAAAPPQSNPPRPAPAANETAFVRLICNVSASLSCKTNVCGKNPAYILASCNRTDIPVDLCNSSLSPYADDVNQNPANLACVAIAVSAYRVTSIKANISRIGKKADKKAASAFSDCSENFSSAREQIISSARAVTKLVSISRRTKRFKDIAAVVQTRMDGAITDENTCMDGVKEMLPEKDPAAAAVEALVNRATELTSIGEAMFKSYIESRLNNKS
ncbi:21 kDa protein-like [Malania oleifera]|uniref:21 kDa protein-like n=1 Tax=Malania oleifera TaxID=397392 RepID=UPI0025AE015B|nr:21 kDa protein-like [Malania oleifera]